MSVARARRARPDSSPRGPDPSSPAEPLLPPRSWWRDPWAWASVLAVAPLVLHSMGAPLGEPAADDIGQLHHALFSPRHTWLDNGGSQSYWRPLAYQGYYGLLTNVILTRPLLVAALHVALLALASLLLYRVLRRSLPGPWAASAASFPLIAESTRALITVPIHFVDVGLIVFSALALHEAAAGRLRSALLGLLAALLCKESAVATGLLMPWIAPSGRAGGRRRWLVGTAAVVLAWVVVYAVVQFRTGLILPRAMDSSLQGLGTHWLGRYLWAAAGSLRAIFSLPAAPTRWDGAFVGAIALIAIVAAACFVRSAAARARFSGMARLVAVGALWTAITTVPLVTVYPVWSPQRVAFNSLGFGVAASATLGAAHPALLASLVGLRLALYSLSPRPPARVTNLPPENGAFVDFEKLVRLQRLVLETRRVLQERHPTLPRGARVGLLRPPLMSEYAYGGSQALQVWYRDSTLRWLRLGEISDHPEMELDAIVLYESDRTPQMMLVEPPAMRHYLRAGEEMQREDLTSALADLAAADSLQVDRTARMFTSNVAGRRALCWLSMGRPIEAERDARHALGLWRECGDARYVLTTVLAFSGRWDAARAELDTLIRLYPNARSALILRDSLGAWAAPDR